ncbi:MAG TPA: type IV pilus modification protein PilV [Marinobacter sp.]|uniref:type IV pilus modification protein PilV n=1 Tax=Marinobacter sp. TaxID=50741 RepID=UPI002D7F115D|nr:type IV pilus modification protein PilV [Marinobacter sp.]HET8801858.1 type IV pilus modification protein PilV [Marinobacter sp.]
MSQENQISRVAAFKSGGDPILNKRMAGFGMIEVLVSLLVLAIGLLGLASLQATGLAQTSEVRNRSQAILLTEDMFERIRSNRENIASYVVAEGNASACNPSFAIANTDVAVNDLSEWKNSLACLLPGGNGSVQVNNQVVTVQIVWDGNTGGANDESLTMEARL